MEYSSRFVLVSAAAPAAAAAYAAYRVHYSCEITYLLLIVGRRRMAFGIVVAAAAMQSWLLSVAAVVFKIA